MSNTELVMIEHTTSKHLPWITPQMSGQLVTILQWTLFLTVANSTYVYVGG